MIRSGAKPSARMRVIDADITTLAVDAIVNAANPQLAPGGGVCGAIHRAAGPQLAVACSKLDGCPIGDAVITPGFALPARHVIHAVGPVWYGGAANEAELLAGAYRSALEVALANELSSIAFPAISTGVYGFPPEQAARVAVRTVGATLQTMSSIAEVVFCCFGPRSTELHRAALAELEEQHT